jgi:hypothetical protein
LLNTKIQQGCLLVLLLLLLDKMLLLQVLLLLLLLVVVLPIVLLPELLLVVRGGVSCWYALLLVLCVYADVTPQTLPQTLKTLVQFRPQPTTPTRECHAP